MTFIFQLLSLLKTTLSNIPFLKKYIIYRRGEGAVGLHLAEEWTEADVTSSTDAK